MRFNSGAHATVLLSSSNIELLRPLLHIESPSLKVILHADIRKLYEQLMAVEEDQEGFFSVPDDVTVYLLSGLPAKILSREVYNRLQEELEITYGTTAVGGELAYRRILMLRLSCILS